MAQFISYANLIDRSLVQGHVVYYEGLNLSYFSSDGPGIEVPTLTDPNGKGEMILPMEGKCCAGKKLLMSSLVSQGLAIPSCGEERSNVTQYLWMSLLGIMVSVERKRQG